MIIVIIHFMLLDCYFPIAGTYSWSSILVNLFFLLFLSKTGSCVGVRVDSELVEWNCEVIITQDWDRDISYPLFYCWNGCQGRASIPLFPTSSGPSPAFPGAVPESQVRGGSTGTQTGTCVRCCQHRWWLPLTCHNTGSSTLTGSQLLGSSKLTCHLAARVESSLCLSSSLVKCFLEAPVDGLSALIWATHNGTQGRFQAPLSALAQYWQLHAFWNEPEDEKNPSFFIPFPSAIQIDMIYKWFLCKI